jgi:DsbE subfamily thiol:disulfide oxidoreductase
MTLAHMGVAIVLAGIIGSLAWKTESLQVMRPGDSVSVAGYDMKFKGVENNIEGPNYTTSRATFIATKNGAFVAEMKPEHRVFRVPPQPVTDAAIHTNFISDLYAVLGEPDGKGGYVTRIYHNPLVPWIFLGAVVMAFGGGISITDRRHRIGAPVRARREKSISLPPASPEKVARKRLFLIPLTAFAVLAGFFVYRLALIEQGDVPNLVPSVMIGRPAPEFDLPPLFSRQAGLKSTDLRGKVTLVNFFASWCVPCRAEHPVLALLAKTHGLVLAGVSYKDNPDTVRAWLARMGDPYEIAAMDNDGRTAIDFGVYGVPETYLIDKQGIVRFKQAGPLTPEIVQTQILPLVAELNK